jgi:hypothetical protein
MLVPMRLARPLLLALSLGGLAMAAPSANSISEPRLVGTDHWAFKPPVRPAVPAVADRSRVANPIDAFVLTRLGAEGLTPSPQADPRTLIRRAYFDVTGLPPTPEEVEAFAADTDPAAYEKLVDRLLASPRYGERWGRHWLDVVRFAESHGFEMNQERPGAYHYRDWVIRAFNEDKPYDQFVREQLAGDALGADAATGFLVGGAWDQVKSPDPVLTANQRADELHDMVSTAGSAFLGLTVGCARCHDHKFDPISQVDYFRFVATFAGVQHGERPMHTPEARERVERVARLDAQLKQVESRLAAYEPLARPGRSYVLVDEPQVTHLVRAAGREPHYDGAGRGERRDAGDGTRLPNVGRGYFYWTDVAGKDVFTWNPAKAGRFRVWLSWGCSWPTHAPDATYHLDADGDLATTADRTPIATADHRRFADGAGDAPPGRARWSGFLDAGEHELNEKSRIVLRGGSAPESYVSADVLLLEAVPSGRETVTSRPARPAVPALRPGLRITRNVDRFAPIRTKYVRFTVLATSGAEPCIDELEIYAPDAPTRNLALASAGAKATASGTFVGSEFHKLEHVNDGLYGNAKSWISNEPGRGWVQIELPEPRDIDRVIWGRDRELKFRDRLATQYRIEVSEEPVEWQAVATAVDRLPYALDGDPPEIYRIGADDAPLSANADLVGLLNQRAALREQLGPSGSADLMGYVGQFQPPGKTFRLARGDPMQPKEEVAPGSLGSVGAPLELPIDAPEQQRRMKLAEWMTDPANPLTARVMVNRMWHYHFGQGLVNTPSDLGNMGAKPTHPELLDWLATELVQQGWRLKPVHRLILLSSTYRQSGAARPDAIERDAGTTLLWRYPPRRLEAEAIRDAVLAVSGGLDDTMGGPGFSVFKPNENYVRVYEPKEQWGPPEFRRMVYHLKIRSQQDATFGAFDCPDGAQITPKRASSTTPLQALNLLNGSFMLRQADLFAERLRSDAGLEPAGQVDRGFRLALGRAPSGVEREAGVRLVAEHGLPAFCRALFNANEFVYVR